MKQEYENNKINYIHLSIGVFILLSFLGFCVYHNNTKYFFDTILTFIFLDIALSLYLSSSSVKKIVAYILCPILLFHKFLIPKKLRNEIKEIEEKIKNET